MITTNEHPCWELVIPDGREIGLFLEDDANPHFHTEQEALDARREYGRDEWDRLSARQLTGEPCTTATCDKCGSVYDEDGDAIFHFFNADVAARELAADEGWSVADDGTVRCSGCLAFDAAVAADA